MIHSIEVQTSRRVEFVDVTSQVQAIVSQSGVESGTCVIHAPHTTAGVTINESADPSVCRDVVSKLNELIPKDVHFTHLEGNSDAHIKSSLVGCNVHVMLENGRLVLGTWQGIFFVEFDGPRSRQIWVKVCSD